SGQGGALRLALRSAYSWWVAFSRWRWSPTVRSQSGTPTRYAARKIAWAPPGSERYNRTNIARSFIEKAEECVKKWRLDARRMLTTPSDDALLSAWMRLYTSGIRKMPSVPTTEKKTPMRMSRLVSASINDDTLFHE